MFRVKQRSRLEYNAEWAMGFKSLTLGSSMKISSSIGLKKTPLKLVIFIGFFTPGMKKFPYLPETRPIRKSYIYLLLTDLF